LNLPVQRLTAITINDLLMAREQHFVQIWQCEQRINQILGQAYPLPSAPQLRSQAKAKKAGRRNDAEPIRLRRLKSDEHAYQVQIQLEGEHLQLLEQDSDLLRSLLNAPAPPLVLLRIDTVRLDHNDAVATVVDNVYKASRQRHRDGERSGS